METSLHRQLKWRYAGVAPDGAAQPQTEVRFGEYRIDAIAGDELVEIQHGSLAAIRDKVSKLLAERTVRVVKPVVARKLLIKKDAKGGVEISRRQSPKLGAFVDVFKDLVYFTRVFPHPRLAIELVLVDVEEHRYPGHGRRRRRRDNDFQVEDQRLVAVREARLLRTPRDLVALVGATLPREFDTADLAAAAGLHRWEAQRIAYCWRNMGAAIVAGKRGNGILYKLTAQGKRRRAG